MKKRAITWTSCAGLRDRSKEHVNRVTDRFAQKTNKLQKKANLFHEIGTELISGHTRGLNPAFGKFPSIFQHIFQEILSRLRYAPLYGSKSKTTLRMGVFWARGRRFCERKLKPKNNLSGQAEGSRVKIPTQNRGGSLRRSFVRYCDVLLLRGTTPKIRGRKLPL